MPHPTPNKVTSWLRVKKYSWGRNPVAGVKILDMYLRCSSRCRCLGNLPEMRWAWPPWQQAVPQWRQCSQTGVCQTHRFASEHSKTGWGRHSLKSCLQGKDIILIGSTWMQSGIERETILDIRPFSTRSNLQGRQKLQVTKRYYWSKNCFCLRNLWKGNRIHGQKVPLRDCWSQSCALASHL